MMQYEFRKLFSGRIKWILLLLILVNAVIYYLYLIPAMPSEEEKRAYTQMKEESIEAGSLERALEEISTEIDQLNQKLIQAIESGNEARLESREEQRLQLLGALKSEYQEALNFYSFIEGIDENAEKLMKFSIFSKEGSFSKRNIEKTSADFESLKGVEVSPEDGSGLNMLQNFVLTDVFVLAAICLMAFQIFGKDGRSGMQKLLGTSVNGRARLRLIQVCMILLGIVVFTAIIYGSNILQTVMTVGFPDIKADVHGISEYRNIAFPCTTGLYLILFMLWKAAAAAGTAVLFQAIIYRLNGNKLSWGILGGLVGISFILWFYLPENPISKIFRYLNIIGIFDTAEFIGDYQNLNFFTYPVDLLTAGAVGIVLVLIAGIVSIAAFPPLNIKVSLCAGRKRKMKKAAESVFLYECYKNLWVQKTGIVFLLLIAVVLYRGENSISEPDVVSRSDYYYGQYSAELIGKSGSELEKAIADLNEMEKDFTDSAQFEAAEIVRHQAQYVSEREESNSAYVNARVWNKIFFDKDTELQNFLIFLIVAVFSMGGLFQYEANSRMNILIHAAANQHKVFWSKFGISCLTGGVCTFIIWISEYVVWYIRYSGTKGMDRAVQSLEGFSEFPFSVTIGTMLWIVMVQRIAAGVAVAILFFFLSQILLSTVQFMIAAALVFILPTIILIIANMEYTNPLVSILRYNMEPLLQYIYMCSSWASVFYKIPLPVYVGIILAAGVLVWCSRKKWDGGFLMSRSV